MTQSLRARLQNLERHLPASRQEEREISDAEVEEFSARLDRNFAEWQIESDRRAKLSLEEQAALLNADHINEIRGRTARRARGLDPDDILDSFADRLSEALISDLQRKIAERDARLAS